MPPAPVDTPIRREAEDALRAADGGDRTLARRLLALVIALAVPAILLALSVRFLATGTFLRWEYGRAGFPQATGIGETGRLALAQRSTEYVVGAAPRDALEGLRVASSPLYTAAEIDHLADVRALLRAINGLAAVGVAVIGLGALLWWRGRLDCLPDALSRGGWLTVGLVVLVGAAIGLAWPLFFVGFHELLFDPGTWQFERDSGLIRLFPERFWRDVAMAIAGLSAVAGLAIVLLARMLRRFRVARSGH